MWEPRRLTPLWVSTDCYRDSFSLTKRTYVLYQCLEKKSQGDICATKAKWLTLFIMRNMRNTQIHSVGKMQSFSMWCLQKPLGFIGLIEVSKSVSCLGCRTVWNWNVIAIFNRSCTVEIEDENVNMHCTAPFRSVGVEPVLKPHLAEGQLPVWLRVTLIAVVSLKYETFNCSALFRFTFLI
jgi:hypothetical protein